MNTGSFSPTCQSEDQDDSLFSLKIHRAFLGSEKRKGGSKMTDKAKGVSVESQIKEIDRKAGKVVIILDNGWTIEFPPGCEPRYALEKDTIYINYDKGPGAGGGDPNLMIARLGKGLCNSVIWHSRHPANLIVRQ